MTLRYAIIGAGMMGREHMRNIALMPDACVSAIVEPDDEMAALTMQMAVETGMQAPKRYTEISDLLSSNIADAVVVVSPNDTHFDMMQKLLLTDLPVLLEKPSATSVDQAWSLVDSAEKRAAPVWVAMEYRYMPPVARIIDEVRNGTIGNTKMISIVEHRFPFLNKIGSWNRFNARTGGTMVEKCCHFFDLMRLVTGSEAIRIFGSGAQDVNFFDERYDGKQPDILDNAFVIVDFENGMRASLDLCMFAEGSYWQEQVSIVGDTGKVQAFVPGPSRFWPGGVERASEVIISPRAERAPTRSEVHVDENLLAAGDHHGSTYFQHLKFYELCIAQTGVPEVTLRDGAHAVTLGAAAEQSIRTGAVVQLENRS
ncbi:Gfo/Idh/MocA family protein [Ahrensia kielensis]|uniref:Gfo/Idh/MocA family protein n=1 Tax=Ahrensia kielensis TaxID=76980 RepID=UPI0003686DB9|nr:Gfo/Idh/MocA family oxidoreductase [Ahrensia kielensis]